MQNVQHNAGLQPWLMYILHAHIGMCKQNLHYQSPLCHPAL